MEQVQTPRQTLELLKDDSDGREQRNIMEQVMALQQRIKFLGAANAHLKDQQKETEQNLYALRSIFVSYKRHAEGVITRQEDNLKTVRAQLKREYEEQERRNEQHLTLVLTTGQAVHRYNTHAQVSLERERQLQRKVSSLKSKLKAITTSYENLRLQFRDYRYEIDEIINHLEEQSTRNYTQSHSRGRSSNRGSVFHESRSISRGSNRRYIYRTSCHRR